MTALGQRLSSVGRSSVRWKLKRPLYRPEARLVAQGIHERVGLETLEVRIAQPDCGVEPFERLGHVAPLRVDSAVYIGPGIARPRLVFRQLRFGVRAAPELFVGHRKAHPSKVIRLRFARGTCTLEVAESIVGKPAICICPLEVGIKSDDLGCGSNGFL